MKTYVLAGLGAIAVWAQAPTLKSVDPRIKAVVGDVSAERIGETMRKLESFGTRNPHSAGDPNHGADAARAWIAETLRSYSPRLEVRFDRHAVKKNGRIVRDLDIVNIVATLPGKSEAGRNVIVSGHYDSMVMVRKQRTTADTEPGQQFDWEATANSPVAPGVCDDGSGTALTMELARVMSGREWEKTLVFVLFDAEEEGLIGSTRFAEEAKKSGIIIDGVLNNDIVGNDVGGNGTKVSNRVYVFSADPADGASRSLARYIKEIAERYTPSMYVDLVFRADRFSRGGDHTPMNKAGFPAVRFTTEAENYKNQHTVTDTFANASPTFTAAVARVNAAAAASLALAPAAPDTTREVKTGAMKGRRVANLGRGKSGYDATLKWSEPAGGGEVAGYEVVMRDTTAPYWQHEWYAGDVKEFAMENTSIDNIVLGVRAVGKDGIESPVSAYTLPERMVFAGTEAERKNTSAALEPK